MTLTVKVAVAGAGVGGLCLADLHAAAAHTIRRWHPDLVRLVGLAAVGVRPAGGWFPRRGRAAARRESGDPRRAARPDTAR